MLKFNSNNKFQIIFQILEPSKDLQVTGVKNLKFPCKVRNTKANNNNKANHNNNLKRLNTHSFYIYIKNKIRETPYLFS